VAEVRSRIERYATVTDGHGSDFAHARARIRALFEPNPEAAADYFASPAGGDVLVKRAARYGLALVKSRLGAHDKALRILQQLVSDYPDDLHYPLALAESHVAAGALRSALSPLRSARARWPDEPILYGAEANVLIKIGEASLAKSMIRAALRLDNDSVVLYRLLARAEGQLGNMAPSFQALAEASYLEGEPTRALAELSRAEKHAGHSTYLATSISARMAVLRELIDRRATH
jgi:predicted Zn-dependent protease